MAAGFKIADAFVEVEGEFNTARLRTSVIAGLRSTSTGLTDISQRIIGKAIVDGIVHAFRAYYMHIEIAFVRAMFRLSPAARNMGRMIGRDLIDGIINGFSATRLRAQLAAQLRAATAGLSASIPVRIDTQRGFLSQAMRRMRAFGAALGKATAVTILGSMAVNLLPGTAALMAGFTQTIVAGLALLPGALVAAGAAVAVFMLAFKSKALGEFVKGTEEIQKKLISLKETVGSTFFAGLSTSVNGLVNDVFPQLWNMLIEISRAFNTAAQSTLAWMRSSTGLGLIRDMFASVRDATSTIMLTLEPLIRSFLILASVGASFLPGMASSFRDIATSWANMLETSAASGALHQWFRDTLDIARQFWEAIRALGGVLKALFEGAEAAGGGFLTTMTTVLNSVRDFLNSVQGQQAMAGFFGGAAMVVGSFMPILKELATALGPIANALLPALSQGLDLLSVAAGPVASMLTAVAQAVAPLLPMLGAELGAALTVASAVIQGLATVLAPVIAFMSDLAVQIMPLVTTAFQTLATQGLAMLTPLVSALSAVLAPLIPIIVQIATQFINGLMPALTGFMTIVSTQVIPIVAQLITQVGAQLMEAFTRIQPLIPAIAEALSQVVVAAGNLLTAIMPLIPIITEMIVRMITWTVNSGIIEVALGTLIVVIRIISGLIGTTTVVITGIINAFRTARDAAGAFASAIRGGLSDALGALRNIGGQVRDLFSGAGQWLISAGRNIISGLIDGIKGMIGSLRSTLGSITSMIPDWKGPMDVDRKLLVPTGQAIMGGLASGIRDGIAGVRDELGNLTMAIPAMAAPMGLPAGGSGGVRIDNVHVQGVWDFTDPAAVERMVSQLHAALAKYERGYA